MIIPTIKKIIKDILSDGKNNEYIPHPSKSVFNFAVSSNCIGCGYCLQVCPTNAIKVFKGRNLICEVCGGLCREICENGAIIGNRYKIDPKKCKRCGYCLIFCPIITILNEIPPIKTPVVVECNNCGLCIDSCPNNAITLDCDNKKVSINRELCTLCLKCIEICPINGIISPRDYINSSVVKIDLNSCIFCGECKNICPLKK